MTDREREVKRAGQPVPGRPPVDRTRLAGCLFGGAMAAAPFLALLYGPTAGLAVATAALAATAALSADAARAAPPAAGRRLRVAAAVNGALAMACLAALLVGLG